jgi:hypothetical protein
MDPSSALRTMPSAINFKPAVLYGYQRIYNLVSISGICNGVSNLDTAEMAALAIRKSCDESDRVLGCVFEIPLSDLASYFEREHRYKPMQVSVGIFPSAADVTTSFSSSSYTSAWTVIQHSDEEYQRSMPPEEFRERVLQYYDGKLWGRSDIFPMRRYSNDVIAAAYKLGGVIWAENFLLCTKLADEERTLIDYYIMFRDRLSQENWEIVGTFMRDSLSSPENERDVVVGAPGDTYLELSRK